VRRQKNLPAPAPNRHLIATASKKRPEFFLAAVRTNATRAWWSTSSDPGFVGAESNPAAFWRLTALAVSSLRGASLRSANPRVLGYVRTEEQNKNLRKKIELVTASSTEPRYEMLKKKPVNLTPELDQVDRVFSVRSRGGPYVG
jgi:hypothetical protein